MEKPRATNGPNEILPSNEFFVWEAEAPVKIRYGETELSRIPPKSIPESLLSSAAKFGDRPALAFKETPEEVGFHFITYRQYLDLTRIVAKAFIKLGLERFHGVGIIGFNSPQWFLSNMGAIHAGGISTGIYTTNSAEAVVYNLKKCNASIAVGEDEVQIQKILACKPQLPGLKAVIQYRGKPQSEGVLSWEELLEIGRKEPDDALDNTLKTIAVNQCCSIIFTSGTTGNPKGVMLSHDNLTWNVQSLGYALDVQDGERLISYLPLSHVAAQSVDIYCTMMHGATVYFANRDALKGGLIKTLLEVKPTRFLGVPRIWEKMAEKLMEKGANVGPIRKAIVTWAKNRALHRNLELVKGINNPSLGYLIARTMVFSKIKAALGLNECRTFLSGSAPLSSEIKKYFASLDILIMDAFGLSESSGAHSINIESAYRLNSIGRSLPGLKTKILNPNEDRRGEICLYGRNVFMGYVDDEEKTKDTLDEDGWLRTGDQGMMDKDGFVFITGRLKEILITSGGENITPVLIEQNVKAELPCVGSAVVVCEERKFLSMLLTFTCETNPSTGEPLDELAEPAKHWLKQIGCPFTTMSEVMASGPEKKILDAVQAGLDLANKKAISNAQRVQKFRILPQDFSIPTGELGPTMKLKRNVVNEKFKNIIDAFYE